MGSKLGVWNGERRCKDGGEGGGVIGTADAEEASFSLRSSRHRVSTGSGPRN